MTSDEVDYSFAVIKWKPVIYIINVQVTCITGYVIVPTFHIYFTSSYAISKQNVFHPPGGKKCRVKAMLKTKLGL